MATDIPLNDWTTVTPAKKPASETKAVGHPLACPPGTAPTNVPAAERVTDGGV